MIDMNGHRAIVTFDAGGQIFTIPSHWPLFDLELMVGRRLPLDSPGEFKFEGVAIFVVETGFVLHVRHPPTGGVVVLDDYLRAFPGWLDRMEREGTPRALILQAAGLQALEWRERYLEWGRLEELRHAEHLITHQGKTFEEVFAWAPHTADRPEMERLRGRLANAGIGAKRKQGGRGKSRDLWPHKRELGILALDILRDHPDGKDLMAACRLACQLRPEWLPKRWTVGSGPAAYLWDAIRKDSKVSVFADRLARSASAHGADCKPHTKKPT